MRRFYRERPAAAWIGTAAAVCAIIAAVGIVTAGGSGSGSLEWITLNCSIWDPGEDLVISLAATGPTNEDGLGCESFTGQLEEEADGVPWRITERPPVPESRPELDCLLDASEEVPVGTLTVTVEQRADLPKSIGRTVCRAMASEDVVELSTDGVVGPWQRRYRETAGST